MPRSNTVSRLHQRWINTLLRHYDPATLLATIAHSCLVLSDDSERFTAQSGVDEKAYGLSSRRRQGHACSAPPYPLLDHQDRRTLPCYTRYLSIH